MQTLSDDFYVVCRKVDLSVYRAALLLIAERLGAMAAIYGSVESVEFLIADAPNCMRMVITHSHVDMHEYVITVENLVRTFDGSWPFTAQERAAAAEFDRLLQRLKCKK